MTPEIYVYGSALTVVLALIGVIWHQLQAKIEKGDTFIVTTLDDNKKSFERSISNVEINLSSRWNEKQTDIGHRLNSGSARMDDLQKQVADLRVDIVKNYDTSEDTRRFVTDLLSPIHSQLTRMERLLERTLTAKQRIDNEH